ncbi:MAG: hypothetical protein JXA91_01150 [Candidatus Thermoplasmatota archaeon]|nr:hypothetical protein [Candidatus Thermoplasmatota archaeon]
MVTNEEIEEYFELFKDVDLANNPSIRIHKLIIDPIIDMREKLKEMRDQLQSRACK